MGRWADALTEMRKALELDPLNPMIGGDLGYDLISNRQYDEAIRHMQTALQLNSEDPDARIALSSAYEGKGMRAEALAEMDKALEIAPTASFVAGSAAGLYCRAGQPEKARKLLVRISEAAKKQYVSPLGPALVHFALGENEEGFRFLEKVREERSADLAFMVTNPVLDSVRSDPRFVSLMKTVGLPESVWAVRSSPK
jgi:tetratricopeptide (TPR) repeat protein